MRRRTPPTHQNHDRWLVSYADFITLLFAFFVVMFASTQTDRGKAREVSESVRQALAHGPMSTALSEILGRDRTPPQKAVVSPANTPPAPDPAAAVHPADLVQSKAALERGLQPELRAGTVQLSLEPRGLVISLREAAFFPSGDDQITIASLPTLARIASEIRAVPNPLRLEGHTDSIPIHNSRFRSNWELSAARAIAMLELFSRQLGIPTGRMSVAGYAENAPVDDNSAEAGRMHNRRVDVVLLSAEAIRTEPRGSFPAAARTAGDVRAH